VRGLRKDRGKSSNQQVIPSPEPASTGEPVSPVDVAPTEPPDTQELTTVEASVEAPVEASVVPAPPVAPDAASTPEAVAEAEPVPPIGESVPLLETVPPVEVPLAPPEPEVLPDPEPESVLADPLIPSAPVEAPAEPEPEPEPRSEAVAEAVAINEVDVAVAAISEDDPEPIGVEAAETATSPDSTGQAAAGNPLPRILAVANQKGGVGKTTTSVNLGAALAELSFRVLVIDLDPQGNATTGLGIDARNFERSMYDVIMRDSSLEDCIEPTSMKNLFVAPATIDLAGAEIELVPAFSRELKLKRAIETVIEDFDFVLIDCPPSLGLITVNALAAADEVLVPIQCEYYALEGLSQLMRNVHLVASNLNAGLEVSTIVLTMYDARTKLSEQVAGEVREHFGNKVCRIIIPRTVRLSEAPSFGQPITAFDPASRGAIAYRELAKEVSGGAS
jgi:chromosome partitioning protein